MDLQDQVNNNQAVMCNTNKQLAESLTILCDLKNKLSDSLSKPPSPQSITIYDKYQQQFSLVMQRLQENIQLLDKHAVDLTQYLNTNCLSAEQICGTIEDVARNRSLFRFLLTKLREGSMSYLQMRALIKYSGGFATTF